VKDLSVIGSFNYKEPMIPRVGKAERLYPKVTIYGNQRLKPYFAYFQEVLTNQVTLAVKKEHTVSVEMLGEGKTGKFRLSIDNKVILMVPVP
jgi:hypothetical protein